MKSLDKITFVLTMVLIIFLNGEECFSGLCFGITFMSGVYFVYWLYCYFLFQKKIKEFHALREDLDHVISKLQTEIDKLKETKL